MTSLSKSHTAVEKSLEILLNFVPDNSQFGTLEISKKLNMNKSTVSRLLQALVSYDLIQKDPHTRKYSLGNAAADLGNAYGQTYEDLLISFAKPHIPKLRDQLQETVVLEVLSGQSTKILYAAEGPGPIIVKQAAGERRPAHASAGGKLLLAYGSQQIQEKYFNLGLPVITQNTITDILELKQYFARILEQGFSVDDEEVHLGIRAVAAPIFNTKNIAVAAVVVAGLEQNMSMENNSKIVSRLLIVSNKISRQFSVSQGDQ